MKKKGNSARKKKSPDMVLHRTFRGTKSVPSATQGLAHKLRNLSVPIIDIRKDNSLLSLGLEDQGHGVWRVNSNLKPTRYHRPIHAKRGKEEIPLVEGGDKNPLGRRGSAVSLKAVTDYRIGGDPVVSGDSRKTSKRGATKTSPILVDLTCDDDENLNSDFVPPAGMRDGKKRQSSLNGNASLGKKESRWAKDRSSGLKVEAEVQSNPEVKTRSSRNQLASTSPNENVVNHKGKKSIPEVSPTSKRDKNVTLPLGSNGVKRSPRVVIKNIAPAVNSVVSPRQRSPVKRIESSTIGGRGAALRKRNDSSDSGTKAKKYGLRSVTPPAGNARKRRKGETCAPPPSVNFTKPAKVQLLQNKKSEGSRKMSSTSNLPKNLSKPEKTSGSSKKNAPAVKSKRNSGSKKNMEVDKDFKVSPSTTANGKSLPKLKLTRKHQNKLQMHWCEICGVELDSLDNKLEHEFRHREPRQLFVMLHRCYLNQPVIKLPMYVSSEELAAIPDPQEDRLSPISIDNEAHPRLPIDDVLNIDEENAYESYSSSDDDCMFGMEAPLGEGGTQGSQSPPSGAPKEVVLCDAATSPFTTPERSTPVKSPKSVSSKERSKRKSQVKMRLWQDSPVTRSGRVVKVTQKTKECMQQQMGCVRVLFSKGDDEGSGANSHATLEGDDVVEERHVENCLEENKHADDNVEENKHADDDVEENKLADDDVEENKHSDDDVEENKLADDDVVENKHSDDDIEENRHSDDDVEENKLSDDDVVENKHADNGVEENKHADVNVEENKLADGDVEENKHADNDAMEQEHVKDDAEGQKHTNDDAMEQEHVEDDAEEHKHAGDDAMENKHAEDETTEPKNGEDDVEEDKPAEEQELVENNAEEQEHGVMGDNYVDDSNNEEDDVMKENYMEDDAVEEKHGEVVVLEKKAEDEVEEELREKESTRVSEQISLGDDSFDVVMKGNEDIVVSNAGDTRKIDPQSPKRDVSPGVELRPTEDYQVHEVSLEDNNAKEIEGHLLTDGGSNDNKDLLVSTEKLTGKENEVDTVNISTGEPSNIGFLPVDSVLATEPSGGTNDSLDTECLESSVVSANEKEGSPENTTELCSEENEKDEGFSSLGTNVGVDEKEKSFEKDEDIENKLNVVPDMTQNIIQEVEPDTFSEKPIDTLDDEKSLEHQEELGETSKKQEATLVCKKSVEDQENDADIIEDISLSLSDDAEEQKAMSDSIQEGKVSEPDNLETVPEKDSALSLVEDKLAIGELLEDAVDDNSKDIMLVDEGNDVLVGGSLAENVEMQESSETEFISVPSDIDISKFNMPDDQGLEDISDDEWSDISDKEMQQSPQFVNGNIGDVEMVEEGPASSIDNMGQEGAMDLEEAEKDAGLSDPMCTGEVAGESLEEEMKDVECAEDAIMSENMVDEMVGVLSSKDNLGLVEAMGPATEVDMTEPVEDLEEGCIAEAINTIQDEQVVLAGKVHADEQVTVEDESERLLASDILRKEKIADTVDENIVEEMNNREDNVLGNDAVTEEVPDVTKLPVNGIELVAVVGSGGDQGDDVLCGERVEVAETSETIFVGGCKGDTVDVLKEHGASVKNEICAASRSKNTNK